MKLKIVENTKWNSNIKETFLVVNEDGDVIARCMERETAEAIISLNMRSAWIGRQ